MPLRPPRHGDSAAPRLEDGAQEALAWRSAMDGATDSQGGGRRKTISDFASLFLKHPYRAPSTTLRVVPLPR